jgi:hypothetical protein
MVFRHQHKSDQQEFFIRQSSVNATRQTTPPRVVGQKLHAAVTRERQFMKVRRARGHA